VSAVSLRSRPAPRTVLAVASLGAAVAFVDATIVNIAFPNIEQSFKGTSISSLSWVLNAYNIVFASFLVAAGRIADLLGRKRMFLIGLELFVFASLLCAIAPSALALIIFRVVQALGAALLVPSSQALVLNAFPPDRRAHGIALLSAVSAAAAGLGPFFGGVLVAADNWRLVFLVNVPIGLAAIVLARRLLVESRTPGRRRMPDLPGALLLALAVALVVLGIVQGHSWGWTSGGVLGCFAGALVIGGVFVWRCTWHRSPIVDLALLRIRTFRAANGAGLIAAAGFYGYTLCNVLFLTGVWRYSVLDAGLAMTPGPFVAAAVAGPTSRLVQRIGHRPVLVAGGLIWGAAVLWFVERVGVRPDFLGIWLPGMVLLGIGAGTLFPNLTGAAVASAPGESFGTATGLNAVSRQIGAALGVALVVAIIGTPTPLTALHAFENAWTFGSACLFTAGAMCLLVGRLPGGEAPSLGEAARVALGAGAEVPGDRGAAAPRARRAINLGTAAREPARAQSAADFLGRVPLFEGLEPELLVAVADRAGHVQLDAGQWLFHEGSAGDAMYVVRAGRLEVVDESSGAVIRELGRGDALGELALLTDSPRSASVRAARRSDLMAISREHFEQLLLDSPALSRALNRVLGEQLRSVRAPVGGVRPRPATVLMIALSDGVPITDLAHGLGEALGRHQSVVLLDGSEVEMADADVLAVYGPELDRAEADHDLVLLDGGSLAAGSRWGAFCLQQADRILAVTAGGPVPAALAERAELRGCDLVAYDVASGSGRLAGWADALQPIETHLVRAGADRGGDLARMARRLSGRSVGVVLSGGGARAFSHIGVLEELLAAGIEIDRVAGVSMGAFVGALFAMGLDPDEIDARCFQEWVQRRPLGDYTVPRHALIRGERARAMLHRTFGAVAIEELARSITCGATELRSGRLVLARSGPLWEAVGMSICLPIIAPPYVRERELLIDGSLIDNLPVAAMADLGEGPVIAVDVKATFEPRPGSRGGAGANGDGAAAREPRTPSLGETLTRVLLLGSANTSESAARHADLVIKPRAEGVGLLEFHQIDAAREAGRVAAREALEQSAAAATIGL
jgi:NTE family protein